MVGRRRPGVVPAPIVARLQAVVAARFRRAHAVVDASRTPRGRRQIFDLGIQTRAALDRINHGVPAQDAGPSREQDNGNGSLMRVLPLALWHRGDDAELADLAALQSRVTHGHLRSQICCALYCLLARATLEMRGLILGRMQSSD